MAENKENMTTTRRMGTGKKKIDIKRKEKESDRLVTFSKRRKGLFKKAHQLYTLSGANIAVLVFSPAGKPYIHGDPSFNDIVDKFYYGTTNANPANDDDVNDDDDDDINNKDCQEIIDLWKSWLGTLDVDGYVNVNDLVVVRNELEQLRDELVKKISDVVE